MAVIEMKMIYQHLKATDEQVVVNGAKHWQIEMSGVNVEEISVWGIIMMRICLLLLMMTRSRDSRGIIHVLKC